jgi:FlaA1/EpsC-like NDP-sugar epimerase
VRFGNVLGSRGSIVPVLQEQIRRGGPVTITHPDMTRYFMSIAEAVLLVLQTPLVAVLGNIFMLEMGRPVRIVDLVRELIRLSGLEADKDISIVFSGIRAGEKIEEELVMPDERLVPTPFDRIMAVHSDGIVDEVSLRLALRELERLARFMDSDGIRALLERLVLIPSAVQPAAGALLAAAHGQH